MRFQFIEEHRDKFPVTRMCEVLVVSSSGYYAWRGRPLSAREMANRELVKKIEAVYNDNYGTYGSPRIYRELEAQGVACSENRVARLMCLYHIRAKQTKGYKVTTKRNKAHPVALNWLKRDFSADRPDHKWLSDITYIPTLEGWLYLALILDLYTRRIVGWAMSDRMTSDLTLAALKMALQRRQPGPGLIHHSDQGSQYTDQAYQALLKDHDIQASMNGVRNWYDNAPMESFIGTLKSEWVHHRVYRTRDEARPDLFSTSKRSTNEWILKAPAEILERDFTLEVLTLFIPGWVETDQIKRIARLICQLDEDVPSTILAFFPAFLMVGTPRPTLSQMLEAYNAVKEVGLRNVKLGNYTVFAQTDEDWDKLLATVGQAGIG
jgi:putative transposase